MLKLPLSYYDESGRILPPRWLYSVFILLCIDWLAFIFSLASRTQTSELLAFFYPQKESLGPSINFEDEYKYYWTYIPHFIHSPFYVYAYAFGDCLVNSLYAVYQDDLEKFDKKYIQLLEAGGSMRYRELLKPFNLDPSQPGFWQKGISVIESFIDQLNEIE